MTCPAISPSHGRKLAGPAAQRNVCTGRTSLYFGMSVAEPRSLLASLPRQAPILLYDGECGVCAASVQFVLRHERTSTSATDRLHFAPLQGELGTRLRQEHPTLAGVDSIIWLAGMFSDSPVILVRSDAVLAVLRYLGGPWHWLAVVGRIVPRMLRDALYEEIARRRYRLAPRVCLLPSAFDPSRFLD